MLKRDCAGCTKESTKNLYIAKMKLDLCEECFISIKAYNMESLLILTNLMKTPNKELECIINTIISNRFPWEIN